MYDIVLFVLCIIGIIIALSVLYSMPYYFLKQFEKSCRDSIKKRDKDLERKEDTNKALRKWLFN